MHMHVEVRGQPWELFLMLHPVETGSPFTGPELAERARVAKQRAPEIHLFQHLPTAGISGFYVGSGDQLRSSYCISLTELSP